MKSSDDKAIKSKDVESASSRKPTVRENKKNSVVSPPLKKKISSK
jgi:hypothetical protein